MNRIIKNILRRPYKFLCLLFRLNIIKTIRVNFALLPFGQAIKFPIVVLGKLKIARLNGKAVFECPIKFGTVIIGKCMDNMPIELNATQLLVDGTLIFKGPCIVGHSTNLVVWEWGKVTIGSYVMLGSGILVKSAYRVSIGDYTRVASGCFVMDTNVHCVKDAVTGRVARTFRPIEIGKHCWLTMNTSVTAGAKIPDYSISTRGAVLNKDYTQNGEIGCLLAGSPAKVLKTNVHRIFDMREESKITKFFYDNPNAEYYQAEVGFEKEENIDVASTFSLS